MPAASVDSPDGHSPLAGAPLMSQLSPEARLELEESAEEVLLSAGETLFVAGDVADAAYSLVSGRLEVAVDGSAVRLLGPGAVLGELALLTSGTRSATVRARRDSVLLRLRPASLLTVMERHPAAGGAVARVLAHQLAHPALPAPAARGLADRGGGRPAPRRPGGRGRRRPDDLPGEARLASSPPARWTAPGWPGSSRTTTSCSWSPPTPTASRAATRAGGPRAVRQADRVVAVATDRAAAHRRPAGSAGGLRPGPGRDGRAR